MKVVTLMDAGVMMLVLLLMVAVLLLVDRLARSERQLSVGKYLVLRMESGVYARWWTLRGG
ncbi:MAG TPA: hypothetical protein VOA64_13430 [Candidatus Dormibacteraeota bacterium]|nr:hypothetical protein [Candidatus Dormibacteraeota bacterium]